MDAVRKDIYNSEIPDFCRDCGARLGGVCGALTPEQLTEFSRQTSRKVVQPGGELHGQGEPVHSYANILKGVVKLTKIMPDGRQQIVGLQFAPDFIGRPFSIESEFSAEAATNIEVCALPKAALEQFVNNISNFGHRLHKQALNELDDARDWMLTLGRKTAREKVATLLHLIATHIAPDKSEVLHFELPLTRQDIGDFLGLTIETVSRQMTKLRQEKVIHVENNRTITVHDFGRLADIAGIDG
ncbi:transcriptional regulator [Shinella sp. SUS2]|uniref:Crp/Fnr family transcriptional regulator n=1 Tax=unclassified Shinella TaxID=2643062 RepID=UPI00067FABF3|nr:MULTISPECIES: Crp/Fnr family transcriptional regulator [unclassified Shinella]ANH08818.1 transcriptional regulator [Shinella sp. HZN7]KNY06777.1 transcriptional regulator [Shinella sp. SUS2]KOC71395.1 transcriptional regulator [Shinella sp. GWS1]MDG4676375.1 Crp/Fnr family transcriptional regulator [Shinella sp. 838]